MRFRKGILTVAVNTLHNRNIHKLGTSVTPGVRPPPKFAILQNAVCIAAKLYPEMT